MVELFARLEAIDRDWITFMLALGHTLGQQGIQNFPERADRGIFRLREKPDAPPLQVFTLLASSARSLRDCPCRSQLPGRLAALMWGHAAHIPAARASP